MSEEEKIMQEDLYEDDKTGNGKGVMAFLNSRFGVWLLGLLFLSFMPMIIKVTRLSYDQEKVKSAKREKLIVEINHRISHIEKIRKPITAVQLNDALFAFYGLDDSLVKQHHWRYYNFKPIFAEFEKVPFRNLLIEITALLEDASNKSETRKLAHKADILRHRYLIVNFNEVMISLEEKELFDLRLIESDTSELRNKYILPILNWKEGFQEKNM